MHMFPLARVIYMPLSAPTTLLRSISTDFSPSLTIPLYNNTLLNNPFTLSTTSQFDYHPVQQSSSSSSSYRFKRIRDDFHDIQPKKRPRLSSTIASHDHSTALSKNVLMLLHDLKPSIEYKLVDQTGPSHRPMFTMAVEVNGQIFQGMASTKKEAKQAAAEKALRAFSQLSHSLSDGITNELTPITTINTDHDLSIIDKDNIPYNIIASDDIYHLQQLKPDAQFEDITSEQNEFQCTISFDQQHFVGTGESKEIARTKAVQLALERLCGICSDKEDNDHRPYAHRDFADRIAICIKEKFNQLTKADIRLQRRRVLSGIVLTHDYNLESMNIICITTGTKCVNNDHHRQNEQSLNDCHAEILARRCLIRYCYEQLNLLIDGKSDQSIFEKITNTNRFRLKSSVTFHLYISTAPCGDARLFSPCETTCIDVKHSLKQSRGLLREKMTVADGTLPLQARTIYRTIQTCNEVANGERFTSMSCSDKLCRWNFIGLQGALLSTLIDPIYFTSIIIGRLYHSEHIRRALYARIEQKVNHLSTPYGLRRPFISTVSSSEMRSTIRAPNHSFLWNCVDQKCESIDTLTGLTVSRESSTVSKAALFHQWISLMNKIKLESISVDYNDAKQSAVNYQTAKTEVNKAFDDSGFGLWLKKPHEHHAVDLSSSDASPRLPEINECIPTVGELLS